VIEYQPMVGKQFNQFLHHFQLKLKAIIELVKEVIIKMKYYLIEERPYQGHQP
jgi:hypothetical protein